MDLYYCTDNFSSIIREIGPIPVCTILKGRRTFLSWYFDLQFNSNLQGIWQYIDPDAPDAIDPKHIEEEFVPFPTYERRLRERLNADFEARWQEWSERQDRVGQQGEDYPPPVKDELTTKSIEKSWKIYCSITDARHTKNLVDSYRLELVGEWLRASVARSILYPIDDELLTSGRSSVQQYVREIRKRYAPRWLLRRAESTAAQNN